MHSVLKNGRRKGILLLSLSTSLSPPWHYLLRGLFERRRYTRSTLLAVFAMGLVSMNTEEDERERYRLSWSEEGRV